MPLSGELVSTVFLPPLVFAAAPQLKWSYFDKESPVTILLSFPGVLVAGLVGAVGAHFLLLLELDRRRAIRSADRHGPRFRARWYWLQRPAQIWRQDRVEKRGPEAPFTA